MHAHTINKQVSEWMYQQSTKKFEKYRFFFFEIEKSSTQSMFFTGPFPHLAPPSHTNRFQRTALPSGTNFVPPVIWNVIISLH